MNVLLNLLENAAPTAIVALLAVLYLQRHITLSYGGLRDKMDRDKEGLHEKIHQVEVGLRKEIHQVDVNLREKMEKDKDELREKMDRDHGDLKKPLAEVSERVAKIEVAVAQRPM